MFPLFATLLLLVLQDVLESWWMPVFAWAVPWWKTSQTWGWPQDRHHLLSPGTISPFSSRPELFGIFGWDEAVWQLWGSAGTPGNGTSQHKVFVDRACLGADGVLWVYYKNRKFCAAKNFQWVYSLDISDYPWQWLKIVKFCYGSCLWITIEVFECILMIPPCICS